MFSQFIAQDQDLLNQMIYINGSASMVHDGRPQSKIRPNPGARGGDHPRLLQGNQEVGIQLIRLR
jgi:hypothetical protein